MNLSVLAIIIATPPLTFRSKGGNSGCFKNCISKELHNTGSIIDPKCNLGEAQFKVQMN